MGLMHDRQAIVKKLIIYICKATLEQLNGDDVLNYIKSELRSYE